MNFQSIFDSCKLASIIFWNHFSLFRFSSRWTSLSDVLYRSGVKGALNVNRNDEGKAAFKILFNLRYPFFQCCLSKFSFLLGILFFAERIFRLGNLHKMYLPIKKKSVNKLLVWSPSPSSKGLALPWKRWLKLYNHNLEIIYIYHNP